MNEDNLSFNWQYTEAIVCFAEMNLDWSWRWIRTFYIVEMVIMILNTESWILNRESQC